jgi:cell division protein FtsL
MRAPAFMTEHSEAGSSTEMKPSASPFKRNTVESIEKVALFILVPLFYIFIASIVFL